MFEVLLFCEGEDKPSPNIKATKILFSSENGPLLEAEFIMPNASPEECNKIESSLNFCLYLDGLGYRVKCTGIKLVSNDYSLLEEYLLAEIFFIGFGEKCTCEKHISYMKFHENKKEFIANIKNGKNVISEAIDDDQKETIDKVNNRFELLDL